MQRRIDRWRSRMRDPDPMPRVIVLGMQKSGTSAIASLLAARCGLTCTIDFPAEFDRPSFHRVVDTATLDRFISRNHAEFTTQVVKEPNLTYMLPLIREKFHRAAFVFVVRSPAYTIRSVLSRLGLPGAEPDTPIQRPLATRGWDVVLDGRWQGFGHCGPVRSLAHRWSRCAELADEHRDSIHVIRYEDFIQDKAVWIDQLAGRLGLTTISPIDDILDVQYQPSTGPRGGTVSTFFGENASIIRDVTRGLGERFGYTETGFGS